MSTARERAEHLVPPIGDTARFRLPLNDPSLRELLVSEVEKRPEEGMAYAIRTLLHEAATARERPPP